jgi:hypothetical protein
MEHLLSLEVRLEEVGSESGSNSSKNLKSATVGVK